MLYGKGKLMSKKAKNILFTAFIFYIVIVSIINYTYLKYDNLQKEHTHHTEESNERNADNTDSASNVSNENKNKIKDENKSELIEIINLGEFKLTAYCPCEICCGKWSGGATASGVMPKANHTIAVDTDVIPFGTEVIINNKKYIAEDTGSAIKGNKIDIYFEDHQEALEFGVQYANVFQLANPLK
jgi:3D (Asp-Asp-Asp) domain-containing protein